MTISELKPSHVYQFTPPKGEYPPCYGKCTVVKINGNMVGLQQLEDKTNPHEIKHDARGERPKDKDNKIIDIPREIGKQRWVHFSSFERIELANA